MPSVSYRDPPATPLPDVIPEAVGFWKPGGGWTSYGDRRAWVESHLPGDRRPRLFAVAAASRSLRFAREEDTETLRHTLAVAERFADGEATRRELVTARQAAAAAYAARAAYAAAAAAAYAAAAADDAAAAVVPTAAAYAAAAVVPTTAAERVQQSRLLTLFLPRPGWRLEWHTEAAVALARGIYSDRAWGVLPILADALEDAGCADPVTLAALRAGVGYRGLWVLDVLTGRASP